MKRSRRVVLTLMGSAALSAVSKGRVRLCNCGPGYDGDTRPTAGSYCCPTSRGLGGSFHHFHGHGSRPWPAMASRRRADNIRMQRIACPERDDWHQTAEACGFDFHTIDGARYWDERGYYAFTLEEIERKSRRRRPRSTPMCLELVGRAVHDEDFFKRLQIPETHLAADPGELGARRQEPLRPARPRLRRTGYGKALNTMPIRRLRSSSRRCFNGPGRTGDRAAHHP